MSDVRAELFARKAPHELIGGLHDLPQRQPLAKLCQRSAVFKLKDVFRA